MRGQGLDLRFTGKLGPDAVRYIEDPPVALSDAFADISHVDFMGRMAGDLGALAVKDLQVKLAHASGADLSLQGRAALGLSEGRPELTSFDATAHLSLPDQTLLDRTLRWSLPNLGAIDGSPEVS